MGDQPKGLDDCDADPGCNRESATLSPYRAAFSELLASRQFVASFEILRNSSQRAALTKLTPVRSRF